MTYSMDTIRVNAYNAMLMHLDSQKGSRLRGLFAEEVAKGEKHFFDRIDVMTASELVSLGAPIVHQDGNFSRRMATLRSFHAGTLVHDIEKLQMLADPTSDLASELMNAIGRNYDDILIEALLGSAATGKTGSGSQAFDTANNQIAHGSTGLTVAKLLEAIKILKRSEIDVDNVPIYLLLDAAAEQDLMSDSNFTSKDFQTIQPLAGREVPKFRGIVNMIHTERLPDQTAGSVYRAIMCTADSLKVALGAQPNISIDKRVDLENQPMQIYVQNTFGAVRMKENAVVDILFQGA